MRTKVRRKNMTLAFEPVETYGQSYEVSTGSQKLGRVSYYQQGDIIRVTELEVQPYLDGFDIESRILDALLADDTVNHIEMISTLSTTGYYEEAGFGLHSKQVLLTKTKT
jgi:hypothetical protein